MSDDSVPNIKFNVAKTIEMIYDKLTNSNKVKSKDCLLKMCNNTDDFDVKFYAEKAIKNIKAWNNNNNNKYVFKYLIIII